MKLNLLFTVNKDYVEHMTDCIHSILRFPTDGGYDIYILHSDLQEEDRKAAAKQVEGEKAVLHFQYVDGELFSGLLESSRYPRLVYYRVFAALLLPEELDRILYLDADTLVINPLDELYQKEFHENYFMACTHVRKVLNKLNQYRLGMEEETSYINSGVLLMNLELLRKVQSMDEVIAYAENRKQYLLLPDQDVITALYGNRTEILDTMRYNLSDRMLVVYNSNPNNKQKLDLDWVRKNTVIIHYYGKQKPWKKPYFGSLDTFYRELKEELKRE